MYGPSMGAWLHGRGADVSGAGGWLIGSTEGQSLLFACKKLAQLLPMIQREFQREHLASDNRDWYRDWWRKNRYVERAGFKMSRLTDSEQTLASGGRYSSSLEHW